MPDNAPAGRPNETRETAATVYSLAEDLSEERVHPTLARGIVWADILSEIAADEAARGMRDAA